MVARNNGNISVAHHASSAYIARPLPKQTNNMGRPLWSIQIAERGEELEERNMPELQDVSDDDASGSEFADEDTDDNRAVNFGTPEGLTRDELLRALYYAAPPAEGSHSIPTAGPSNPSIPTAGPSSLNPRRSDTPDMYQRMLLEVRRTQEMSAGEFAAPRMSLTQWAPARGASAPPGAGYMGALLVGGPPSYRENVWARSVSAPPQEGSYLARDVSPPPLPGEAGFIVDREYAGRLPSMPPPTATFAPAPQGGFVYTERQPSPPRGPDSMDEQ